MSFESAYVCNVCGARKLETNHWWGAELRPANNTLIIRPWTEWAAEEEMTHHLCGKGCALVLTERYLDGNL